MATQIIPTSEQQRIEATLVPLKQRVAAIVEHGVTTASEYADAGDVLREIKGQEKTAQGILKPYVDIAKRAWEDAKAQMDRQVNPFSQLKEMVSRPMEAYAAEERRKAEMEQARQREEARKEAARIAEEQRKAAEAQAAEERKKRLAEIEFQKGIGELKKKEAAELARQAKEQEERDREAARIAAERQAMEVASVVVEANIPKVAGIKRRVNYKFRVVDAAKIPHAYLMPDLVKIGEMVRRTKNTAKAEAECPGIEAYEEDSV